MKKTFFAPQVRLLKFILPVIITVLSANLFGQTVYYSNNFEDGNMAAEVGTSTIELLGANSQCVVVNNPSPTGLNTSAKVFRSMAGVGQAATSNRGRAELSSQRIPTKEKVHTYEFQVYFPTDYFAGITYEFQYTSQFKTYPCEKASGYDICTEGGGIFNDITFNPSQYNFRYRANPSCYTATPSLELGVWTDFKMEIYWTKTMNGWVRLYKNNVLVYSRSNINTLFSDWSETGSCDIYWAIGQYTRWNPNGTGRLHRVAYYDNISVKEGVGTPPPSCGSPVAWSNSSFTNQTGSFTAEFDAVPGGSTMDGVVGLSNGAASVYSQLACAVQFATDGTIKARNGSAYTAGTPVNYTAGTSYRIRMNVNVTNKMYSIYATPSGGSQQTIGINYAFRTEQSSVTQLNNRAVSTLDCSLAVSNFTVGATVTAPAAPTGLTALSGNGQVSLSWTASTGATSYTVKRSTTSGTGYSNVAANVTTTSFTNSGLTNGTTYYYVVSASNSGGTSGNSSQVSATPTNGLINETFTSSAANFTVVRGGTWTVTGGKYVLTSAATTGAANGNISIHNTTVSGDYTLTADASATASSSAWDDFSIIFNYQNATNYYYVSLNESNDANTSGIFKISGGVITQLADITSLIIGGTTYAIKIERNGNTITAYRNGTQIATASDGTFTSGKVGFGTLNNGASFDNLIVNGGVSAVGRMRTSSTDTTSEIQRTEESPEISIYPNPTSGRFSVEVSTDMATGYLNVMDAYGRTILSKELNGNRKADIDLSEKTSGVYLVSVVKDGKKVQTKLVKK